MTGTILAFPVPSSKHPPLSGDTVIPLRPAKPEDDRKGGGGGDDAGGRGATPPPDFGPVVALGTEMRKEERVFALLAAGGQRVILSAKKLQTVADLSGLFGGHRRKAWMAERWPQMRPKRDATGRVVRDDEGRIEQVETGDFSARDLGDALIQACVDLGPAHALDHRRDGVWPGPDGGLVVHVGDRLWTFPDNVERSFGWRHGNALHLAADARPAPAAAEKAATKQDCLALEATLKLWNYHPDVAAAAPAYLLGGIAAGIYCAALEWVPHIWLSGPAGAGKSTLLRFMAAASGADAPAEDVSEPFVRNVHNGRAHAILLDEKEPNTKGVNEVLALMRAASSGGRSGRLMDGAVTSYAVHAPFILAAISTPAFEAADLSRITVIQLRRGGTASDEHLEKQLAAARALYPALLTRAVLGWPRFLENRKVYRRALLAAAATSRCADQLATLLAGRRTLIDDDVMDESSARDELSDLNIEVISADRAEETDAGRLALSHLLASSIRLGADGKNATVAALLEELRDLGEDLKAAITADPSYSEIEGRLKRRIREAGQLKLRWSHGEGVYIGHTSPTLNRIFEGTTWANRVWRQVLKELPGAHDGTSIYFRGGGQDRAVFVPEAALRLPGPKADDPLAQVQPAVAEAPPDA